ncbi:MAG TPA: response regulator [Opitutaceae bacterium]|nr:response regulator [Opitutaceae bacterium]
MKAKILVVDDSGLSRRTARRILEEMGHQVEEAPGGAEALEHYFLNRPHLVLLDMVMDGIYGLDVLIQLRQIDPEAKVIVVTADIQQSTQDQAKDAGACAFLNKPLNKQRLSETVTSVLET